MARPLRLEFAGACYHVINRGNYRRNLFAQNGAGEAFERTLEAAAVRFRWRVHAYVIMRNHFHLAIELSEPNLSEGMRWLQATWVRRYNRFRKLVGKPFQGRYKALLVQRGHGLAQVGHYIHLNPVRAGIFEPAEAGHYQLSSLRRFLQKKRPDWLEASVLLDDCGHLPDSARGWKKYLEYLEFLSTDETAQKELVAKRLSRGWIIGDKRFRSEMLRAAKDRNIDLSRGRFETFASSELKKEREQLWEEHLQSLISLTKIKLDRLLSKKSDWSKVLLAASMKLSSSASNEWLANRLQMGQPASVSQFARRAMLNPEQRLQIEKLVSRIKH